MSIELLALSATVTGEPEVRVRSPYVAESVVGGSIPMPWSVSIGDVRLWVQSRTVLEALRDACDSALTAYPEEES